MMSYSDSSPNSGPSSKENSPLYSCGDVRPIDKQKAQQMEQRSVEMARFMEVQEKFYAYSSDTQESLKQERIEAKNQMQHRRAEYVARAETRFREKEARKDARLREKMRIKLMTCDMSKLYPLQREMVEEELMRYRSGSSHGGD